MNNILGLYSKRPEYFCEGFPTYYKKAKGCYVWDESGKKYIDMSHIGFSACVLGYNNKIVNNAAKRAINNGSFSLLNPKYDKINANTLTNIHLWADKIRFTRSGGEACLVAVEIARANTNKTGILQCGYNGWKLENEKHKKFYYNDVESFYNVLDKNIGIVIVEAMRYEEPTEEWLELLREISKKYILIIDEITSGFRFAYGGIHQHWNLEPSMCVFGKSMSNGYPCGAVLMNDKMSEKDVFISSTYWTDSVTPAAIKNTLAIHQYIPKWILWKVGQQIKKIIKDAAEFNNIDIELNKACEIIRFDFKYDNSNALETLYTQLMLREDFLATNIIYPSYAHSVKALIKFAHAIYKVFAVMAKHINEPEKILVGKEKSIKKV